MAFPSLFEATEAFRSFMAGYGYVTNDPILETNATKYLHAIGDKKNEKKLGYTFHYDRNISGGFVKYNDPSQPWINWRYFKDSEPNQPKTHSPEEEVKIKKQFEEAKKQKEQQKKLEKEAKLKKLQEAIQAYESGEHVPDSYPYFQNKKLTLSKANLIKGYEPKLCFDPFYNQKIVYIPFFQYDILNFKYKLTGFERIFPDGSKKSLGFKNGSASFIGYPFFREAQRDDYYVTEGYGTALAVHFATGKAVMCANGSGNLKEYNNGNTFERLEAKLYATIASDDDKYPNKDGIVTNEGQKIAIELAAKNPSLKLAKPTFPQELENWAASQIPPIKLTDFADVFKYLGEEETKNQLSKAKTLKEMKQNTPKQELIEYAFYDQYEPDSGIEAVKHAFKANIELNAKTAKNAQRYQNILAHLQSCGFNVFKSQFNEYFIEILHNLKGLYGVYCISPNSQGLKQFKAAIKAEFHILYNDFLGDVALEQLIAFLSYEAEYRSIKVYNRIAKYEDAYYINFATEYTKKAIKITKNEISFVEDSPVFFISSFNAQPFVMPDLSADIIFLKTEFRNMCKITDDDFWFLVTFIIDCWMPETSYQLLMITGEEGTSKSTLQKMIVDIIDPNVVKIVKLNQDNLLVPIIVSTKRHLLSYDNESELQGESQDNFCAITTGAGTESRALYTNSDVHSIVSKSPIIVNGLYDFVDRPDLKSRTIHIKTILKDDPEQKSTHTRRDYDDEVEQNWLDLRSKVVGSLLNLFQQCINKAEELKNSFPAKTRQATYLRLLHCIGLIVGDENLSNRFLKAGQEDSLEMILSEPVAVTIMNIANKALDYKMVSVEDFLVELKNTYLYDPVIQKMSTKALGWNIKRLTPSLRKAGFNITKTYLGGKYDRKLYYKIEKPEITHNQQLKIGTI
jgi:hypothetical protein